VSDQQNIRPAGTVTAADEKVAEELIIGPSSVHRPSVRPEAFLAAVGDRVHATYGIRAAVHADHVRERRGEVRFSSSDEIAQGVNVHALKLA